MTTIIALAGRKSSGKDTVGKFLTSHQKEFWGGYKTIWKYAFADELKAFCAEYLDVPAELMWGTEEQKNTIIPHILWENMPHYSNIPLDYALRPRSGPMTVREILQEVGTGWFRKVNKNIWINRLLRNIKSGNPDFAVITDMRFINEVEAVKNAGGLVIYLNRKIPPISNHPSEAELETYDKFDLIIKNHDMSIDEANQCFYNFLLSKGIINV